MEHAPWRCLKNDERATVTISMASRRNPSLPSHVGLKAGLGAKGGPGSARARKWSSISHMTLFLISPIRCLLTAIVMFPYRTSIHRYLQGEPPCSDLAVSKSPNALIHGGSSTHHPQWDTQGWLRRRPASLRFLPAFGLLQPLGTRNWRAFLTSLPCLRETYVEHYDGLVLFE